jgi:hypothetical protein
MGDRFGSPDEPAYFHLHSSWNPLDLVRLCLPYPGQEKEKREKKEKNKKERFLNLIQDVEGAIEV